ncbi:MAG: aminopeptidase P family protein [Deltaproteobacteria bacterium]|nr:aminopeptidase P family protein [Deltaproteobacteria bacterium]
MEKHCDDRLDDGFSNRLRGISMDYGGMMISDSVNKRLYRFRELMDREKIDTFLVTVPENRFYLSGFEADDLQLTESSGALLVSPSSQFLLTDFRYREEAEEQAPGYEIHIYSDGMPQVLKDLFLSLGTERLGVEGHFLTWVRFQEVEKALRESRPSGQMVATDGLVEELRVIKEPGEIELIRQSLNLTEEALVSVWEDLTIGRRERDVAWAIESFIRQSGGEDVSFPPIVASGPNAALPHAVPSDRRIEAGEPVILDLGSRLHHYCSDMTRTWIAGTPSDWLREIYRVVREAQLAAQDAVRSGVESVDVDAAARALITKAGYGERFGHGLGHGVGLAVHEKPGLRRVKGMVLQENMVVTVEPGIYLPGYGGVRLENMVRVTATGCEVLNRQDLIYSF